MTTNHPVDRLRPTAIGAGIDSCPGFRLDYYTDETVRDRPEHRYCECGWTEAHHVEEESRG